MANVFNIGCLGKTLLQYSNRSSSVGSTVCAATYDVMCSGLIPVPGHVSQISDAKWNAVGNQLQGWLTSHRPIMHFADSFGVHPVRDDIREILGRFACRSRSTRS